MKANYTYISNASDMDSIIFAERNDQNTKAVQASSIINELT